MPGGFLQQNRQNAYRNLVRYDEYKPEWYVFITSQIQTDEKKKTVSHIINIGSILGQVGRLESTAYCATKFGMKGFMKCLLPRVAFLASR